MRATRNALAAALLLASVLALPVAASTVAWYRFEEGLSGSVAHGPILDSSDNGLNGTPSGTTGPTYTPGIALAGALALSFNGAGDGVFVPDDPRLQLTRSLTLEAFLNLRTFKTAYNANWIIWRGDDRSGLDSYMLVIQPGTQKLEFWVQSGYVSHAELLVPYTWLGQTVHVAGTLDDNTGYMALYVNGELLNSTTTTARAQGPLDPTQNPGLRIGGYNKWFDLDGIIDEVRLSDQALQPGQFLCATQPVLTWTGEAGFTADGVDPDQGGSSDGSSPTTFTFRVKWLQRYFQPTTKACVIERRDGSNWVDYRALAMGLASGTPATGLVYTASTTLPAGTYQYRFNFAGAPGRATGDPTSAHAGPVVTGTAGPPKLAWVGTGGFKRDGVDPDAGHPGARFTYQVKYSDSAGRRPTLHRLLLRRNGKLYKQVEMKPSSGGSYQSGKRYSCTTTLTTLGRYEYCFSFAQGQRAATGAPTAWKLGPRMSAKSRAALVSLTSVPCGSGAQVIVSLSAPAGVTVTLLNAAGRPIRTLCRDRLGEAGRNVLLWDGRTDQGLAAPNGTYLIQLAARSADGSQARALTTAKVAR